MAGGSELSAATTDPRRERALWDVQIIEAFYGGDSLVISEAGRALDRLRLYLEGDRLVYTR